MLNFEDQLQIFTEHRVLFIKHWETHELERIFLHLRTIISDYDFAKRNAFKPRTSAGIFFRRSVDLCFAKESRRIVQKLGGRQESFRTSRRVAVLRPLCHRFKEKCSAFKRMQEVFAQICRYLLASGS